jgi:hypothetical protein
VEAEHDVHDGRSIESSPGRPPPITGERRPNRRRWGTSDR